ncbi:hypothetical protein OAA90_00410 [Salibacteraceae bacterium]|nr:hypothetical protein [Salibacteraceae bacterium]
MMIRFERILIPILFVFAQNNSQAQELVYDKFFKPLYEFDLVEAEKRIETDFSNVAEGDRILFTIHLNWWKLISGYLEEDGFLEESNQLIEKHIKWLETFNEDKSINIQKLKLLNAYLFRSRVQLLDDNYLTALSDLRKCILVMEDLNKQNYNSDELQLVNALYNYYHDFAYQNYFLLRPILMSYPKGNMQEGLDSLKYLSENSNWAVEAEATYFLAKIYLESEEKPNESMFYTKILLSKYPNNIIYSVKYAKALKAAEMEERYITYCLNEAQRSINLKGIPVRSKEHLNHLFNKMAEDY